MSFNNSNFPPSLASPYTYQQPNPQQVLFNFRIVKHYFQLVLRGVQTPLPSDTYGTYDECRHQESVIRCIQGNIDQLKHQAANFRSLCAVITRIEALVHELRYLVRRRNVTDFDRPLNTSQEAEVIRDKFAALEGELHNMLRMSQGVPVSLRLLGGHGGNSHYMGFISHSGDNKVTMAYPLYNMLRGRGLNAFLDCEALHAGEVAERQIVHALETAKIGIFILSKAFVLRKWPMKELECFIDRHRRGENIRILPVFYELRVEECKQFEKYIREGKLECIGEKIADDGELREKLTKLLKYVARFTGIRNDMGANNRESVQMQSRRAELVQRITNEVSRMDSEIRSAYYK